jgi:subtilisin-like proprotein convertase family protein
VAACGGQAQTAAGVWYTVNGSGTTIRLSTCTGDGGSASYDTKISVYCQDCAALTCVGANDDGPAASCPGFQSRLDFCGQAGGSYRILVHGFGAGTGNFSLSASDSGVACTPAADCLPPVPQGSCCTTAAQPFEQGEVVVDCFQGTAAECAAAGGTYGGDNSLCFTPIGAFDYVVNPALPIPDNTPTGVDSTIAIADAFLVADVNVDIGITHTWISDLIIEVTSPAGTSQVIWNQVCGSTDNINATADDAGTETFCAPIAAGPIDSVFYPPALAGDGPLAVFNGETATGTWTLNVSDNYALDTGTLNQWSLHFIGAAPVCTPFTCPTVEPPDDGDHGDHGDHGDNEGDDEEDDEEDENDNGDHDWWWNHDDDEDDEEDDEHDGYADMETAVGSTASGFGQTHSNHSSNDRDTRPAPRPQIRR